MPSGSEEKKDDVVSDKVDSMDVDGVDDAGKKTVEDAKKTSNEKKEKKEDEISEEDLLLKEGLELAVLRLQEEDTSLHEQSLNHLINEIRSATSSMTSVPKPLKFLRPHYDSLKEVYEEWPISHEMKTKMADVLSVLAMTMAPQGSRECLKFKLQGVLVDIASWGHEYVRSLSGEISEEYNARMESTEEDVDSDDLMTLVDDIIPFQMSHNAEADAVDLLMEVQRLHKLVDMPVVDERNYERVCLYLIRSADFMADPDDLANLLNTAYRLYKQQEKYCDALRVALRIDDNDKIAELFSIDMLPTLKNQMAFILARHRSNFAVEDEELNEIIGNVKLSDRFLAVAREMDVVDPKSPEDIYKSQPSNSRSRNTAVQAESARGNLASTFVNAFVNAAHNKDKLMTEEGNSWVFKNKDHGMLSAAASLGMVMLWNQDEGLSQMDPYFHCTDTSGQGYIKAGTCLGVGILSCGVRSEADAALAVLSDNLEDPLENIRIGAICGLGIAYAGAQREEIMELLVPIVANTEDAKIAEVSFAALSLGLVFVGTCNDDVGSALVQRLMESSEEELNHTMMRFLCLGLGLLYLGKNERADAMLEAVRTVEHRTGKYAEITLETCAHAGTGNVLKVQQMLRICTEHLTENADHQAVAALGIALVAAGEDIGTEMTLRTFEHLLHYSELPIKRVVPLALALMYISNPDYGVIDQLSRLSHGQDPETSQCAILGLGLVSAGTNNSRVAGLLRSLSDFYAKEANHLFVVRLAQGLLAMGKGLIGLSPFNSDRLLLNGPAMGGILAVMHACLDVKNTILDKYHFILFFLTTAMNPRYLQTVDEDMNPVSISVRVGQSVETVGQAGRPKTITGFQTHTTPVLLGPRERAELASREYKAVSAVLENIVIVKKVEQPPEGDVTVR